MSDAFEKDSLVISSLLFAKDNPSLIFPAIKKLNEYGVSAFAFKSIIYENLPNEAISYADENGETRVVLKLPAALAPVKLAVMPLVKKDGLPEKAREIINDLKFHFNCQYDEKDSIGKRYRRQDAIGTPYCVTVDHDTLKDNCVTLRFRDTMEQERVPIAELNSIIEDKVSLASLLKKIQ